MIASNPIEPNASAAPPDAGTTLQSLLDMLVDGGPLMVPIGLCSIVSLAYVVERSLRMRSGSLGTGRLGRSIVAAAREGGPDGALELCRGRSAALARVIGAGLARVDRPVLEIEKAVEDAGGREVKRLNSNLRPLVVVAMIAPLLGLLGTVWGMIEAFSSIALQDGLGKPELLASGISQALITTAAGLAVAIPTQAAYYWFKSRIDRFVQLAEDVYVELSDVIDGARAGGRAA